METNNKHTPTPWRVRYLPDGKDCFVEADKIKPEHRYDIEIMGDDTGGDYYPYEQKEVDCHFIVTACNDYEALKQQNEEYGELLKEIHEYLKPNDKNYVGSGSKLHQSIQNLLTKYQK